MSRERRRTDLVRLLVLLACALAAMLTSPTATWAQGTGELTAPPTKGALYRDGPGDRYLLGGTWLYRADPGDVGVAQGLWRDTSDTTGWGQVAVPNSFNAHDLSDASMNGSVGWYRRDFTVPSQAFAGYVAPAQRFWIVRFESVNYRATVWLNGRKLGGHAGAFLPFEFDLKGLRPGVNHLVVRVDSRRGPGDLPPGPGGGWWNFGGILREVYLRSVQRVDMPAVRLRPTLPCLSCAARITALATLRNLTGSAQKVTLRGRYGPVALDFGARTVSPHATITAVASATLPRPRLWSPARPYLYRASLTLADGSGHALLGWQTYSGVRRVVVTKGGRLTLNGRYLNLRGFNLHEQDVFTGGVLTPQRTSQLLGWIRQVGGTLIRSHYPLSPELQEEADRTGMLIWSEVPVYQLSRETLEDPTVVARTHEVLRSNIATNENHPSVLLWSIGNELPTPADGAEWAYIRGAAAVAHRLDPTRPVGMAVSAWPGVDCQGAYAPLDVIGFNDYFGWFDAGGGTTDDRDALSPFLDSFRACYPTKAIFVSEFGVEGNRNGPVEERGTYQFQSDSAAFHLAAFATKAWLSGAIWFPLQDFAARPGWGGGNPLPDPPFVQKGLFDVFGNPKPVAAVISQIYHHTVQIGASPGR